jgi:hypothetical protein
VSIILNHRSDSVSPVYLQRANQVVASRRLGQATELGATALSVDTKPTRRTARKVRAKGGTVPRGQSKRKLVREA